MPRKKKKKKTGTPVTIRLIAALLIVALIGGIGLVKLFQTTYGRIILLDAGFGEYYALVQQEIETKLRAPIETFGFDETLRRTVENTTIGGRVYAVRHWEAACVDACSAAKIGLAFTKAVEKTGATTTSKLEGNADDATIHITVGSRRYPTHSITITPRREAVSSPTPLTPRPRLALVIDDFGYSKSNLIESFLEMDIPLTIAVLPTLPRSAYVLERAGAEGKETLLHLPMEAERENAPGPWVATEMSEGDIRELVERYVSESSGIVGVNNHQGSVATRDPRVMFVVLSVIGDHDLFFLDSLTSAKSIAYNTAKSMAVPTAKNDLFLDDDTEDPDIVEERLWRLITRAKRRGTAIGIGHPKRWTLEAISRNEERLRQSGVELVFVSELME